MESDYRPLRAVAGTVLLAGLVTGLAFAGLSESTVLVGVAVLACLMVALFIVGRRDESNDSDEHDHHATSGSTH
jgi:hypothetical protein